MSHKLVSLFSYPFYKMTIINRFSMIYISTAVGVMSGVQFAIAGDCIDNGNHWICSGAASIGDSGLTVNQSDHIEIITDPDFGLNITNNRYGFHIKGENGLIFKDEHGAIIETNGDIGLFAENENNGDIDILSTGSLISTNATGSGIRVHNESGTGKIMLDLNDTEGGRDGITIDYKGDDTVTLISRGMARGHAANGIYGYIWSGSDVTIASHDAHGGNEGITINNRGDGALKITSTGLAKGDSHRGILADNLGTDVDVTAHNTDGGTVGLEVNQRGTGALLVNSTGIANGGTSGLHVANYSGTDTIINAVDTTGNYIGIRALHNGSGSLSITSTGRAYGAGDIGIYAQTGSQVSRVEIIAHDAEGGVDGIYTNIGSAIQDPDNRASIQVTGHIQGSSGYGIYTETQSGVMTNIQVEATSTVESTAGNAIANNWGDSHVTIVNGATVNGRVHLGAGNDTLNLFGGLSGLTVIDGGGGGTDILNLTDANHSTHVGSDIRNWSIINLDNSSLSLTGGNINVGAVGDSSTGIFINTNSILDGRQDNFSLNGNMSIASSARFLAANDGVSTNVITGNVLNAGLITSSGGITTGNHLRIDGDYAGQNGRLILETQLDDDSSVTDRLDIGGDTAGNTLVQIMNMGGQGAATSEGIEVISVGGASNGLFTLVGDYTINSVPVVVAGTYAYQLTKGNASGSNTDNWYLRSALLNNTPVYQPGVPVYEVYPQALMGINKLSTLQQRVGNRFWLNEHQQSEVHGWGVQSGFWGRVEGGYGDIEAHVSTTQTRFNQNSFKMQAGVDGLLHTTAQGTLLAGLTAHYTQSAVDTRSVHGKGKITTDGYGLGAIATWYGKDGVYWDGQAQATWYKSDLRASLGRTDLVTDHKGFGYTLSAEAGKKHIVNQAWSITPQIQFVYSNIDVDSFVDVYGTSIRQGKGENLQGRLGVTLDHDVSWQNKYGKTNKRHTYGIINVYHEFLDGSQIKVADQRFQFKQDRTWGGVGLGGTYSWNDDAYAVYIEGLVNSSLENIGKSYSLQGTVGFRMSW